MKKALILLVVLLSSLVGCFSNKDIIKERNIQYEDFFNVSDEYIIYVYANSCPACNEIKEKVISFLNNNDNVYTLDCDTFKVNIKETNVDTAREELKGVNTFENLYFVTSPSLYFINEGVIIDALIGAQYVSQYISNN